jgi:hypothetical protein
LGAQTLDHTSCALSTRPAHHRHGSGT